MSCSVRWNVRPQASGAGWRPPVVVVDGLDEARDQAFAIASELLVRLGRWATVIVSTRNLPGPRDGPDLLATLAPVATIDLDDPEIAKTGQDAIRRYITQRLDGVSSTMDAAAVAEHFLVQTDPVEGQPFLIARLMTDQLRSAPVNTTVAGWQAGVSTSVAQAFYHDLAEVADPTHVTAALLPPARRAEELLTALTWGVGAGLPENEWLVVASATSSTATEYTRDDIGWLLATLGRYVVEDGQDGTAVYRVAHQTLADQLRPAFRRTADIPFDPHALKVGKALLNHYEAELSAGRPPDEPRYLWRYAWRHAAAACPDGLTYLRALATLWPDLTVDLALACTEVSVVLASFGRHVDALPLAEEAVRLRRERAADNPAYLPDLATALTNLGVCYSEVGRRRRGAGRHRGGRRRLPRAGRRQPRLPARPGQNADQPRHPLQRAGPAR